MKASEILKKPYIRVLIPDSGAFAAEIAELPGCVSCGKTAKSALDNLERAAEAWIEAALEQGITIPSPRGAFGYSGRLLIRIPKSLHGKLALLAASEGVSLNQFIATVLAEAAGRKTNVQP